MHIIPFPHDAAASHEKALGLIERAGAAGLTANVRVVLARDPRDPTSAWRPACGRIDVCREGDPRPVECRPKHWVRFLEERVAVTELVECLRVAMSGGVFEIAGARVEEHGMASAWRAYHHTSRPDWECEGTSWPCVSLLANDEIPKRMYFRDIVEDDGPRRVHNGLEPLARYATGFGRLDGPGFDQRLRRFQVLVWDYRGRLDGMTINGGKVSVLVSPRRAEGLRLVGFLQGASTRLPVVENAPGEHDLALPEPVIAARFELKRDDEVIAEAERNLREEEVAALLDGRVSEDPCDILIEAIRRALRPAFDDPPTSEKDVQRQVEQILRTLDVEFHREKEHAVVGPTTFKPDFTLPQLDAAIEIKLARKGHGAVAIQKEIMQDVVPYRTRWGRLLVVVYDADGTIRDPAAFCDANEQKQ